MVQERWFALDGIFVIVEGDGFDLQQLANNRKDVFSSCEKDPSDFEI